MKRIAEFTSADGKRVGIPTFAAVTIMDVTKSETIEGQPKEAKTLLRYIIGNGSRIAWLRDTFKHVLSALPFSARGAWAHCTDDKGNDLVVPQNSIAAFEEIDDDTFFVTLDVPGGIIGARLRTSYDDMVKHIGLAGDAEEPAVEQDGQNPVEDESPEGKADEK